MIDGTIIWGNRSKISEGLAALFSIGATEVMVTPILTGDDPEGSYQETISILASNCVYLNCFKQLSLRFAEHDFRSGAEVSREIADRHAGAVDLAIITGEEEVHVFAVSDQALIDGTVDRARDLAREQGLRL